MKRKHPSFMKTTTRFKNILKKNNVEIRIDDAGTFEIYLFNKKSKTVCVFEGKTWSLLIAKIHRRLNHLT